MGRRVGEPHSAVEPGRAWGAERGGQSSVRPGRHLVQWLPPRLLAPAAVEGDPWRPPID